MINFLKKKRIYADWAATTPIHPKVKKIMDQSFDFWQNPSAIYKEGVNTRKKIENARKEISTLLSLKSDEIYFTSGGTESNNLIIQGIINKYNSAFNDIHIVSTEIEHSSILETLKNFEKLGVSVTYIKPDKNGIISPDEIISCVNEKTKLVTCMYVNNEIGTIQPISKIGSGIRKLREDKGYDVVFHTDASQAPLWLSCDVEGLRVDSMTLDGHKIQGPKGVGILALKRGIDIKPTLFGGDQERGIRPTTENLSSILGINEALKIANINREKRVKKMLLIKNYFLDLLKNLENDLKKDISFKLAINGSIEKRVENNINISINIIPDPEIAILQLDKEGVICSTKSSCLKGQEESYVIKSILNSENDFWRARNSLRFSLSPETKKEDIVFIIKKIKYIIRQWSILQNNK